MSYRGLPDLGFPSAQAFYQASWHGLVECLTHHRLNLNLSEYDLLLSSAEWLVEQVPGFNLVTTKDRSQVIRDWCDFLASFGCEKSEVLRHFTTSKSVRGIAKLEIKQYNLAESQICLQYDKTLAKANRQKRGLPALTPSAPAKESKKSRRARKAQKAKATKTAQAANPIVVGKQTVPSYNNLTCVKDVAVQTGSKPGEEDSPDQPNATDSGTTCKHISACRQCSSLISKFFQQTINGSRPSPTSPSAIGITVSESTNHDPQLDTRTAIDIFETEDLPFSMAPEKSTSEIACPRCSGQDHTLRDCPTNLDPKFEKPPPGHYKCCVCGATGDHYTTLCPFYASLSSFTQRRKQRGTDERSHDVEERHVTRSSTVHRETADQQYEGWLESQKERLDQEQHSGGPTTSGSNAIPVGSRETNRSPKFLISRAEAEKQSPALESRKRKRSNSVISLELKSNGAAQRDARFLPTLLSGPYLPSKSRSLSSPKANTRLAGFSKLLQTPRGGPESVTTKFNTCEDGRLSPYELSPGPRKRIKMSESCKTSCFDQQITAATYGQSWEKAGKDADVLLDILQEKLQNHLHDHSQQQTSTCEAMTDAPGLNAVSSPTRPGSHMFSSNTTNARCDVSATRVSHDLTEAPRKVTRTEESPMTEDGSTHEEAISSFFTDMTLHQESERASSSNEVIPYQTEKPLARIPPYDVSVVNLFKSRHHPYVNTRKCQTAVQMLDRDRDEDNMIEEGEILERA